MQVHVIWPEDRWVSEETIQGWYKDAVDNGEVDGPREVDTVAAIYALNDIGFITTTDEVKSDGS